MGKVISVGPYSAYGIAVKHGYEGTEEEWISSVERDRIAAEKAAKEAKEFAKADPTLTISGAPADAATTGQKLDDRYTKAEIDDKLKNIKTDKTLTVDGGFADAKAVGDRIDAIKTDKTLSVEGTAADAKATGDALAGKLDVDGNAGSVNGFNFMAQTTDPGADTTLATGTVLIVYE